ncbi:TM0996/MTH895 family glutaredoxin-like protein [Clostridiaceae bacterium UIB06]|nr:TM0996/MTH895 family glutaredoxin-like protein [Clostridiaceae bacterium UIB06]
MEIKILGSGCANCKKLEANAKKAVETMGISAQITKVEDIKEIMKYGVMRTPAIVINEKVKSFGKVLSPDQIVKLIEDEQ